MLSLSTSPERVCSGPVQWKSPLKGQSPLKKMRFDPSQKSSDLAGSFAQAVSSSSGKRSVPITWEKETNSRQENAKTRQVSRNLFSMQNEGEKEKEVVLTTYKKYLGGTLRHNETISQHAEVCEQILKIELFLDRHASSIEKSSVQERIQTILSFSSFERKMGELGLLLFYLDRDQKLPDSFSLIAYRGGEMDKEIEKYIDLHEQANNDPKIPSGKTHYTLRAFAHMIFTSSQEFNKGALIAIKEMLKNPMCQVIKHLQSQHRKQIIKIVNNLVNEPRFEVLFHKVFKAFPDLEDAIRIDLKLRPDEQVHSVHILYASLMYLFADVRQYNTINCYAISALIYVTTNNTYEALTNLLEWVESGVYAFDAEKKIPIRPLLEKKWMSRAELDVKVSAEGMQSLVPLGHISGTLQLKKEGSPSSPKLASISESLYELTRANDALEHFHYAERLYHAYKYSNLVLMQLAVLECAYINTKEAKNTGPSPFSYLKTNLIDSFFDYFQKAAAEKQKSLDSSFMERLYTKLGEALWLECHTHEDISIQSQKLVVGSRNITFYRGGLRALANVFRDSIGVFYLHEGRSRSLYSITDLSSVVKRIVEETALEFSASGEEISKEAMAHLIRTASSKGFRDSISRCMARQIDKEEIAARDLNQADLLIFEQKGGNAGQVLKIIYNISFHSERVKDVETPYRFLEQLLEKLQNIDAELLQTLDPQLIMRTPGSHAWTLSPDCWKLLLENQADFYPFIQKTIFNAANARLASPIPRKTWIRVLDRYSGDDEQYFQKLKSAFDNVDKMTYGQFREQLLGRVHTSQISYAKRVIDEEFSKITLCQEDLHQLLEHMNLQLYHPSTIEKILERVGQEPQYPSQIAHKIRLALIEEKLAIKEPYELEIALCKVMRLPPPIYVGDLNWADMNREDPFHLLLGIMYNWGSKTLSYYIQDQNSRRKEPNTKYSLFEISYPEIFARQKEGSTSNS